MQIKVKLDTAMPKISFHIAVACAFFLGCITSASTVSSSERNAHKTYAKKKSEHHHRGHGSMRKYKRAVVLKIARTNNRRIRHVKNERPGLRAAVRFTILKSGKIKAVKLLHSSGNRAFDRRALKMVKRSAPFPPLPWGIDRSLSFTVPIASVR
jgi:TonB family protein